jgi:hypothetical protein
MSRWPHAKMSQFQSTRSPMLYYRYLLPEASCIGRENVVQLAARVPVWLPIRLVAYLRTLRQQNPSKACETLAGFVKLLTILPSP